MISLIDTKYLVMPEKKVALIVDFVGWLEKVEPNASSPISHSDEPNTAIFEGFVRRGMTVEFDSEEDYAMFLLKYQ